MNLYQTYGYYNIVQKWGHPLDINVNSQVVKPIWFDIRHNAFSLFNLVTHTTPNLTDYTHIVVLFSPADFLAPNLNVILGMVGWLGAGELAAEESSLTWNELYNKHVSLFVI